jgi:hypothetical protein
MNQPTPAPIESATSRASNVKAVSINVVVYGFSVNE